MTIDEAIKHCEEQVAKYERQCGFGISKEGKEYNSQCAAEHRQLAEWLTELKEANAIIRVCNRVLGFLLEHEIESTSTRHEVETLLKNITEYLSGEDEDGRI